MTTSLSHSHSHLLSQVQLRVRGYHLDGYGHVNNARYLEFMEEGRWDFFDQHPALIKQLHQAGRAFVVVNLNIDYLAAALQGDDLTVMTGIVDVGERSALCHHRIVRKDGKVVAQADLTFVLLDMRANKAAAIEGEVRDKLSELILAKEAFVV
ncbi:MAG: acyl-CoA thioesterase [Halomonas sp.]|nr:thioesterase family protein [Halomonas sp.]TVP45748.1 MAG: acyl-CoA thioesterase [Halomonas sp.]